MLYRNKPQKVINFLIIKIKSPLKFLGGYWKWNGFWYSCGKLNQISVYTNYFNP